MHTNIARCFPDLSRRAHQRLVRGHFKAFGQALAGQSPEYLKAQINAWRVGWRRNDPMGLMRNVANYLTGPEIEAVAAYYASLPPPPPDGP